MSAAATDTAGTAAGTSDAGSASGVPARIGDTVGLKGSETGESVDVTAVKVIDHALGADADSNVPPAGKHYFAVQFRIKNTGTKPYEDAPANGAKVVDNFGEVVEASAGDETTAGPSLPTPTTVPPGGVALGLLTFEVPNGTTIAKVQFGMDSGFGETTQWQIPGARS
jgi:hypothetical protein